MRILAISGSLRRDSHNTKLLRAAGELVSSDIEFGFYDDLESVPPYNEDRDTEDAPLAVRQLRESIRQTPS
jgi:chromate reductase, NAD(P)H dehydrogenase (quinone)